MLAFKNNKLERIRDQRAELAQDMKNTKAAAIPVSVCKKEDVKSIVREQFEETLAEVDLKAEVSPESSQQMNEQIEKMKEIAKRPPLLSLHLNLTAKVFAIIMALLFFLGIAGYVWFINTPMYLGMNSISHTQGSTIRTREQDIPQHTAS